MDKKIFDEIRRSLDFQIQFYAKIFHDDTPNSFNAKIFATEKEFLKYSKEKANFNPRRTHSIAFYDPDLKEMILHKEVEDFSKTFTHELSHAILHYYCKKADTWIDEGLAEFFEDIIFLDSTYYFDVSQMRKIERVKSFLLEGASIAEAVNSKDFYAYPNIRNYTLSWSVILFLYKANSEILSKIVRGDCTGEVDTLILNYPGNINLLQVDIKSFYLNFKPIQE